jgi:flagellar hook-associated protein 2
MDALRVGGIISGLDTNGIVDTYSAYAKIPLDRLQAKYDLKSLEKSVYKSIDSDLTKIKNNLLNFKLESTFKSKTITSSNTSIVSASATVDAAVGSYSVEVSQTARQAFWTSHYTSAHLIESGAGITSISGTPKDVLEGTHEVTVSTISSSYTLINDEFSSENLGSITKISGSNPISIVNNSGTNPIGGLNTDVTSETFSIDVDGTTFTVDNINGTTGEDISKIMQQIEDGLNSQLNTHFNTTDIQYVAMRASFDSSADEWTASLYKTSLEEFSISVQNSGIASDLGMSTTVSSTTDTIVKSYADTDTGDLLTKINDSDYGLIPGVTLTGSLTDGTFKIFQDSSLNSTLGSSTKITGNTVSSGSGLNTSVTGIQNAGLAKTVDSNLNGTFTINNVQITIEDYTTLSVNDLLGKINSSGAGVTATYDSTNDKIILTANENGSTAISLGSYSDTSNFFDTFRLSSGEGATFELGSVDGYIDDTKALNSAGFSKSVTSGIFTINGVSIYVDAAKDTLKDVINKVNNSGAGVTMSYDKNRDRITIKSDDKDIITFGSSSDTSSFLEAAKLTEDTTVETSLGYEGQSAVFKVDGITYLRDTNVVDDVLNGITLNLNNSGSESVTVNVEINNTKSIDVIATFVQQFNELMTRLNPPELTDEDKKYLEPLTDADKQKMSTDEINEYEEKWKKFNEYEIIRKSSELKSMKQSLRNSVTATLTGVDSKFKTLSELGLDIAGGTDFEVLNKGMLVVDSTDIDTIKENLNNNFTLLGNLKNFSNDVYNFFAQASNSENSLDGAGWSRRYEMTINTYTDDDGLIGNKIKPYGSLDRQMDMIMKDYKMQETRVEQYLERLWAQFAAMEQKINDLQTQSAALANMTMPQQK